MIPCLLQPHRMREEPKAAGSQPDWLCVPSQHYGERARLPLRAVIIAPTDRQREFQRAANLSQIAEAKDRTVTGQ